MHEVPRTLPLRLFWAATTLFLLGGALSLLSLYCLLWLVGWDTQPMYPEGHPTLWEDRWSLVLCSGVALAGLLMIASSVWLWHRRQTSSRRGFPVLTRLASQVDDDLNSSNA